MHHGMETIGDPTFKSVGKSTPVGMADQNKAPEILLIHNLFELVDMSPKADVPMQVLRIATQPLETGDENPVSALAKRRADTVKSPAAMPGAVNQKHVVPWCHGGGSPA
jgi:hypothetical protein